MDAVKNDVKRLVKIELAAANKKFRMFAGPHACPICHTLLEP